MINNKKLLMIVVGLLPIVVISFVFKNGEANFHLAEENYAKNEESKDLEVPKNEDVKSEKTVRVLVDGVVEKLNLEEYIVGVVAGEMPASFDIEALKAQAVASRTYALYKRNTSQNNEFDLTDNVNTQVYLTQSDMQKKWNEDYQKYYDKIKEAVASTENEVITYNGNIIQSFYFAMSAGSTENVENVFNENRDYLTSVISEYDNNSLKNYEVKKEFSKEEFKEKLNLTCSEIAIDFINYNESGYVNEISVCSKVIKGVDFRKQLDLRSANFTVDIGPNVSVVTKGYGHGVGMSQYGANGYANHGYTYEDIIKHYYSGVEISKL